MWKIWTFFLFCLLRLCEQHQINFYEYEFSRIEAVDSGRTQHDTDKQIEIRVWIGRYILERQADEREREREGEREREYNRETTLNYESAECWWGKYISVTRAWISIIPTKQIHLRMMMESRDVGMSIPHHRHRWKIEDSWWETMTPILNRFCKCQKCRRKEFDDVTYYVYVMWQGATVCDRLTVLYNFM